MAPIIIPVSCYVVRVWSINILLPDNHYKKKGVQVNEVFYPIIWSKHSTLYRIIWLVKGSTTWAGAWWGPGLSWAGCTLSQCSITGRTLHKRQLLLSWWFSWQSEIRWGPVTASVTVPLTQRLFRQSLLLLLANWLTWAQESYLESWAGNDVGL